MVNWVFPALILIILAPLFYRTDLLGHAVKFSIPMHELCLAMAPKSPWQPYYQALVCGSNLPESEFLDSLRVTSLLHIAIVSGSHLALLEVILKRSMPNQLRPQLTISIIMFIYTLMTGWQPPAVRALLSITVHFFSLKTKLYWTSTQSTFFAGLLTWSFFPEWFNSYSLLLSWGASLGLSVLSAAPTEKFHMQWKTHFMVYLVLLPMILPFGGAHPATILCNWLIGPIFGVLFFPMSLLAYFLPFIVPLIDPLWSLAAKIILWVGTLFPELDQGFRISTAPLWAYLFFLHACAAATFTLQKRSSL